MVMGEPGLCKRKQVFQPHVAVIGQADEPPVYGLKERFGDHDRSMEDGCAAVKADTVQFAVKPKEGRRRHRRHASASSTSSSTGSAGPT